MERDGNVASRCEDNLKFPGKIENEVFIKEILCVLEFRVSCLLSTTNTQPHTIIINSHSYFSFFPLSYLSYQFSQVDCVFMCFAFLQFRVISRQTFVQFLKLYSRSRQNTRFPHDLSFQVTTKFRVQVLL